LNDFASSERVAIAEDLAGIIRLVRRICILREQGEADRAARLHADELVAAIAEYRLWHGPDSLTDEKICAVFVNETELVQEAMVLAELMAPQLARLLPQARPGAAPMVPSAPAERAAIRPLPEGPPAITDLLDAMLAAERPGRPPPANQRQP
jgi:hypothetical protein